jgi:DNA polymerase IV
MQSLSYKALSFQVKWLYHLEFVEQLPIHKFHGVGKATALKMQALGIHNSNDLKGLALEDLQQHFGKSGLYNYNIARGIDNRPVVSYRKSQSVGVETTFQQDINTIEVVRDHLQQLFAKALIKVTEKKLSAHTITVKIKYHDFVQITRSRTLQQTITDTANIKGLLDVLLNNTDVGKRDVRLLGITLSSFDDTQKQSTLVQADLFENTWL